MAAAAAVKRTTKTTPEKESSPDKSTPKRQAKGHKAQLDTSALTDSVAEIPGTPQVNYCSYAIYSR